jgi:hypothetical protein
MFRRILILILILGTGCGTIGGDNGGSDNLPNRGTAGYTHLARLLPDAQGPAALVENDKVLLYFTRDLKIWVAEGDGVTFGEPALVLENAAFPSATADRLAYVDLVNDASLVVATRAEPSVPLSRIERNGENLSGPALAGGRLYYNRNGQVVSELGPALAHPGGEADIRVAKSSTGRESYRMMYQALDENDQLVINFAASFDGATFTDSSINPVIAGSQPSNIYFRGKYLLYYTQPDELGISVAENAPAAPSETF